MANTIFQQFGRMTTNNSIEKNFNMFMKQMRGINPNAVINQLLSSGRITQEQLNKATKQAENYKTQLENARKNFNL